MSDHAEHPCRLCGSLLHFKFGYCGSCWGKLPPEQRFLLEEEDHSFEEWAEQRTGMTAHDWVERVREATT